MDYLCESGLGGACVVGSKKLLELGVLHYLFTNLTWKGEMRDSCALVISPEMKTLEFLFLALA